jgi:phage terminase small subunit
MTKKKTEREGVFAREYVKDLNGTRAAIAAGYSPKTARSAASRLLTKDNIKTLIAELTKTKADKLDVSAERVLRELAFMAFANMKDYIGVQQDGMAYVDLSKLTRDQAAAIQEITTEEFTLPESEYEEARTVTKVKFKLSDKRGSLELLGKYLKLFNDRTELTGPGGSPLEMTVNVIAGRAPAEN